MMKTSNKRCILYVLCVTLLFMLSCEKGGDEPEKHRTLMVYLAGNNNLAGTLRGNIRDMMRAWEKGMDGNIVIFYEGNGGDAPRLLTFEKVNGEAREKVLKTYEGMKAAAPGTLRQVTRDMQALFPAESYGMIFGSHASGWIVPSLEGRTAARAMMSGTPLTRSFAFEMDARDMAAAIPDGMDFIVFDACLMSSVETLYEFRHKAKYIVACPMETPFAGFPYDQIMPYFWRKGEELTGDLKKVCELYATRFSTGDEKQFAAIALIDAGELENLHGLTREVLRGRLKEAAGVGESDVYCYPQVARYYKYDIFFDLKDYVEYMMRFNPAGPSLADYEKQLEKTVLYKMVTNPFYGTTIRKFCGIATYIPRGVWPEETAAYLGFPWARVYE